MMSNNTSYSTNPLSKQDELRAFESSFFPAGGAAKLANIPQAPPAPKNINNVRSKPINLKTRNWGNKLENGYAGVNRSLYDRPNVFYWDAAPVLSERPHVSSNKNRSLSSSSSSSNIPQAPRLPQWNKHRSDNLIKGKKLRTRNWGKPTKHGWSHMNRDLYNRENGLNLERNVIINELWAQFQPKNKGSMERGIAMEQPQFIQQQIPAVRTSLVTVTTKVIPLQAGATSVPVPMLNPPLNDGRVYSKLYNQNTSANGISSLVNQRGTRRDHLVQPSAPLVGNIPLATNSFSQGPMMGTGTILAPGTSTLPNLVPSKKMLKTQQKMLKKQNRRDAKLMKKGIIPPSTLATPSFAPVTAAPLTPLSVNGLGSLDRGLTGGSPTSTGIIGPVATTIVGGSPAMIPSMNSFVKQESFVNVPNVSLVGSPMM